jgi:hypothetical protein
MPKRLTLHIRITIQLYGYKMKNHYANRFNELKVWPVLTALFIHSRFSPTPIGHMLRWHALLSVLFYFVGNSAGKSQYWGSYDAYNR